MNFQVLSVVFAFAIDTSIGDPVYFCHPVRLMGNFISFAESIFISRGDKVITGAFTTLSLVFLSSYPVYLLLIFLKENFFVWWFCLEVILIYTTLSMRDLYEHSKKIVDALNKKNINSAKKNVSMIVGRDVDDMKEEDICRAAVESVAENFVDGVVSPLFFAFLGGAPLALAFKAVSTLDSMIGYKNNKYREFGMIAARLDDIANYIPARIAFLLIPLASMVLGYSGWFSLKTGIKDYKKSPSPNSGIPEACIAGALKIQLGGVISYSGVEKKKPCIGENINPIHQTHIVDTNRIVATSSVLFLLLCSTFLILVA